MKKDNVFSLAIVAIVAIVALFTLTTSPHTMMVSGGSVGHATQIQNLVETQDGVTVCYGEPNSCIDGISYEWGGFDPETCELIGPPLIRECPNGCNSYGTACNPALSKIHIEIIRGFR